MGNRGRRNVELRHKSCRRSQILLKPFHKDGVREAGCDEAGRGCLAGPVYAAAVILPKKYRNRELNDSKQLTARQRDRLRNEIISEAAAWCIASCSNTEIDEMNILRASITAMHRAIAGLEVEPLLLLIDGNRFYRYGDIPHHTIIRGDATYLSIAAASCWQKPSETATWRSLTSSTPATVGGTTRDIQPRNTAKPLQKTAQPVSPDVVQPD
jgi:ribonuclease HII